MVVTANFSNKRIHPQEGLKKQKKSFFHFRLHPYTKSTITRSSLVVQQNGLRHLVPHVILHMVIYWLLIFLKMAAHMAKTEVGFLI